MNGRQNTFRLQHWQLAERQRYLADLESLALRLRADVDELNREIERSGAAEPVSVAALAERRDKLVGTISEVDGQVAEAREAVASAQQEVKVFEGSGAYRGFTFEDRRVRRTRRSI
jgi:hypothetical protein